MQHLMVDILESERKNQKNNIKKTTYIFFVFSSLVCNKKTYCCCCCCFCWLFFPQHFHSFFFLSYKYIYFLNTLCREMLETEEKKQNKKTICIISPRNAVVVVYVYTHLYIYMKIYISIYIYIYENYSGNIFFF